jgi:serine protease Do
MLSRTLSVVIVSLFGESRTRVAWPRHLRGHAAECRIIIRNGEHNDHVALVRRSCSPLTASALAEVVKGLALLLAMLLLPCSAFAAEDEPSPAKQLAVAEAVSPSLVRVEYTLQYDKAEAPLAVGWAERCPTCGRYHANPDFDQLIKEERPLEAAGFLVAPTKVLTRDLAMHPRFIKSIMVRFGDQMIEAHPAAYAKDHIAVLLDLAKPLDGARPLDFAAGVQPPYLAVSYARKDGVWTAAVQPFTPKAEMAPGGRRMLSVPPSSLICDESGKPVAITMKDELPLDDSWKGSPLTWPAITADEMKSLLAAEEKQADRAVVRVALSFRSPKKGGGRDMWEFTDDSDSSRTEQNVAGVLIGEKRVLVLFEAKPKITARLTKIVVHPAEGQPVPAKFAGSLKDYGGFIAELESPLPGALALSDESLLELPRKLLLAGDIVFQGEKRVSYFNHVRVSALEEKWRQRLFPSTAGGDRSLWSFFLFDPAMRLVALPIRHREPITMGDERWQRSEWSVLLPAVYLKEMMADLPKHVDAANVPLSDQDENRLAWMGVALQGLDKELARANNVSDQTRDGETGAMVSYVYPDSPAADAGIEPGYILLRLDVQGEPKPLEVRAEGAPGSSFPWEMLDEASESDLEHVPPPWLSAENTLTRALTDLGFGRRYIAELFHDGKIIRKELAIVESPPHYESAPRIKSQELGLTVRDMTYEVRRYFQKEPKDPGIVVSKVEPGGKAAVAGIRPFEVITHVNDSPVQNVKDFEKLIAGQTELRLAVKRLTQGRIVRIKMSGSTTKKSEDAGSEPGARATGS